MAAGWLPDVANWHLGLVAVVEPVRRDGVGAARGGQEARRRRRAPISTSRAKSSGSPPSAPTSISTPRCSALPGLQSAVDAARANQAQADARFKAGLGTIVELADAEALLTNAQLELAVGQFTRGARPRQRSVV